MLLLDRKALLFSLIVIPLAIFSYVNFLVYQPKILREIATVKGARTVNAFNIPFPDGSVRISSDQTSSGQQFILDVPKLANDVQSFYKSVLLSSDWKLEGESMNVTGYSRGDQKIIITTTQKDNNSGTILSIEYSR